MYVVPIVAGEHVPHLQFHHEGQPLFRHLLRPGGVVLIGRSDRCDVALPSEAISRIHCMVERRSEGWWLRDRSKHGTLVNGAPIRRHLLAHGDELRLGDYGARFSLQDDPGLDVPTVSTPLPVAAHEELVGLAEDRLASSRATLRLGERTILLTRHRSAIGGPEAAVELHADLPSDAVFVRVVRGRVMIEPGSRPAWLAGSRVREITPAFPGEEVRVDGHSFVVEVNTLEQAPSQAAFGEMVGQSKAMGHLFAVLARMALHEAPVLLNGASGTGKELAARGVHEAGPRHAGPFVALNCAAIAENLFESELFGHEKGAFTGATARQDGAFQRADGGTLFLDEVGELKLDAQAKLLRALESGEVRRVGASEVSFPDVRVVAATNRNLSRMVKEGRFRNDLFFRLAVLTVRLPGLSERPEDIALLARTLVARHHPGAQLTEDAISALQGYAWPGNVRELRNVLTRAFVLGGPVISASSLSFNPWAFDEAPTPSLRPDLELERQHLREVLQQHGGNRSAAARALGIPRTSLLYKLRRLGIEVR